MAFNPFFDHPILNSPYAIPQAIGDSTPPANQPTDPSHAPPAENDLRFSVDQWRRLPSPSDWLVSPETTRLLQHWRHQNFQGVRPFFCQMEAMETVIWLSEVAPKLGKSARPFLDHLANANRDANPDLFRLALKLATGMGCGSCKAMVTEMAEWACGGETEEDHGFIIVFPAYRSPKPELIQACHEQNLKSVSAVFRALAGGKEYPAAAFLEV